MKIFSWVDAIKKSSLPPVTRHVLLNLSTYMNQDGESCYPSIDEQARTTGLSRKCVIGHLNHAVGMGFLYKTTHQFKGQKWRRNEYCAVFPKICELINADDIAAEGGELHTPIELELSVRHTPEGGVLHSQKVVSHVHSNYPVNSPKETKERKYTKKPALVNLQDWEDANKKLDAMMMVTWCKEKRLTRNVVSGLIEEFRTEMIGKGKTYADFRAAFQTYLTKGYLSLNLVGAQNVSARETAHVTDANINRRGGDL